MCSPLFGYQYRIHRQRKAVPTNLQYIIMKNNRLFLFIAVLGVACLFSACQLHTKSEQSYISKNGIYYWRTTFCPTMEERVFVREHNIGRIYLHMYDVDVVGYATGYATDYIEPVATIQFQDSLISGVEYVPTVYITQNAIRSLTGREREIAEKIVTRTLNMVDWHEIPNVQEIQIDGDWQVSTQKSYFLFCREMRELLHKQELRLSATIRLSQLREAAPPVDRGVLMLYNTGSVRSINTTNSILDIETCRTYLRQQAIEKYALPLDYALPVFGWSVIHTDNGKSYGGLSYTTVYSAPQFERIDSTHYRACFSGNYDNRYFNSDDMVRIEKVSINQLHELKRLLPRENNQAIILYHLDNNQTNCYSHEEIDAIFAH